MGSSGWEYETMPGITGRDPIRQQCCRIPAIRFNGKWYQTVATWYAQCFRG